MQLVITINLDNNVFQGNRLSYEAGRILLGANARLVGDFDFGPGWQLGLFDLNGNRVGKAEVID